MHDIAEPGHLCKLVRLKANVLTYLQDISDIYTEDYAQTLILVSDAAIEGRETEWSTL
ncbi:MAG TPA: hypothetical protein VIJ25_07665 [Methylococcales bacterium]